MMFSQLAGVIFVGKQQPQEPQQQSIYSHNADVTNPPFCEGMFLE